MIAAGREGHETGATRAVDAGRIPPPSMPGVPPIGVSWRECRESIEFERERAVLRDARGSKGGRR